MCGFVGFIDEDNSYDKDKKDIIKSMSDKIIHRGPDSEGYYIGGKAAIGFRRLSIIDLVGGDQPIYNETENLAIFFNGEIYNFKELRAKLINKGHIFTTATDTETVLHGYEEYGEEIASKLRGMFSFIIYDKKTDGIYGARDYFGIKPFYYYLDQDSDIFIFGSEIKSFLPHPKFKKELNKNILKLYLTFQYSPLEETFFKNVYKLRQGCYFTYKNSEFKTMRYFDISYNTENKVFGEYVSSLSETLKSSVEYHQISDVEVGTFLSGGVDSSFIASTAKPAKTFSVGFAEDGFDESMYAKELSDILKIENYKKIVSSDEFFDALPSVQYHSDEPHANLSAVPLYYLSQKAAEYVKVVLSGEGADELFAGYFSFAESYFSKVYTKLPYRFRKFIKNLIKPLPNFKGKETLIKYGRKVEDYYIGQAFIMDDWEANNILSDDYKSGISYKDVTAPYFEQVKDKSDLIKMLYLDLFLWLPNDILLKADKMTMAYSLELRVPFLDKEVFALASKIPSEYLVKNKVTKRIFRETANKIIPTEWAKRKKVGFPVPFALWLKEQKYFDILENIFNEDFASEFFIKDKLFIMLNEHFKGLKNNGRKLYVIYTFLLWYKIYFLEYETGK